MLKFELLKIYREKTIYILSALLALVIFTPFLLGHSQFDYIQYYESNFKENNKTIENIKNDPTATETVSDIKEVNGYLGELIASIKNENSKKMLDSELKYEHKNLEDMEAGKLNAGSLIDQKTKVAVLHYLTTHGIEKISENSKDLGSVNYLSLLISMPQFVLVLLILISFHIAYIFNLDYRKNNFIIYNNSPKTYLKLFFVKFFANILAILLNIIGVFVLVLSIVGIKNGLGNTRYPIATIQNNSEVSIISTSNFVFKVLFFLFLFCIFLGLIGLFLSILSSNLLLNISVLILPLVLGQYDLLNTFINHNLKPFIILSYIDISHIIVGGSGFQPITNPTITFNNGLLLLLFSISICLILLLIILIKFPKRLIYNKFPK